MPHTYTFTPVTNGATEFKIDSGPSHMLEQTDGVDQLDNTHLSIYGYYSAISRYINHNGDITIDLAVDTVIADGVTYGPGSDIATVYRALNPLFPKGKSSSAGTGVVQVATKAAANSISRAAGQFIRVAADESQTDSPKAMYMDLGTLPLEFQYFIP